jgi:hypothetical protein
MLEVESEKLFDESDEILSLLKGVIKSLMQVQK